MNSYSCAAYKLFLCILPTIEVCAATAHTYIPICMSYAVYDVHIGLQQSYVTVLH